MNEDNNYDSQQERESHESRLELIASICKRLFCPEVPEDEEEELRF